MSSSSKLRLSSGLSEDLSHPQGFHSDGSAGPGRTSACGHGGALRALLRDRDCLGLEHMGGRYARPLGALGAQDGLGGRGGLGGQDGQGGQGGQDDQDAEHG